MKIAVSDAEAHLADLLRRARSGDERELTSAGEPNGRLLPPKRGDDPAARRALIDDICAAAAAKAVPGPSAARSQDFLYDPETGLPARSSQTRPLSLQR